ncbi:MAG TPA: imelysin family protein [Polyangiaceae bacterium]|nr:imelysin family protein [Polyangiaceae bacterium]
MRTFLVACVVLVGCSEPSATQEDTRRVLLKGLGEQVFLPRYVEFEERVGEVRQQADALCADPSDDTLAAVRDAWWEARAPWKRNETVAFGPYLPPDSYGAAIDFWPCRVASVDAVLVGTEPIEPSLLGAAAKGMPAFEYLIYDPARDPVTEIGDDPRFCEYLGAVGVDLAEDATAIRAAWDPAEGDFLGELVEAGRGSKTYDSIEMALGAVVNRLVYDLEALRGEKLGVPLGMRTGGTVQPDSAESRFSGRSLEDVRDGVRGIEEVVFGAAVEKPASLAGYLDGIGRDDLVPALREAFDASYAALDAVPQPLTEAVVTNPELVQASIDALGELQRLIQTDVINAMGLMLTFTDADGD